MKWLLSFNAESQSSYGDGFNLYRAFADLTSYVTGRKIHKAQRLNGTVTPFWYQRSQEEEHGNYRLLFYSDMTLRVRVKVM